MSPISNPFLRGYQNLRIDRSLCITYADDCPPVWRPLHPSQAHLPDNQVALFPCVFSNDFALITEGRFSGASRGISIGHVSPEAAAGGAIALIEDGDEIEIDLPNRSLNLLVEDTVLEARRKKIRPFAPKIKTGWLARYSALVTSANTGGVMKSFDEIMRDRK